MDILDQYQRAEWLTAETFTLAADRITIRSALRYCELIQAIHPHPLRGLSHMPIVTRSRSDGFAFASLLVLMALWLACAWVLSGGSHVGIEFPVTMVVVALSGVAWVWRCSRRWYAVRFYTEVGGLAFTLRCPSQDSTALEGFVASVVRQIRSVNPAA